MNLAPPRPLTRNDFDAALRPGFREATRSAYDRLRSGSSTLVATYNPAATDPSGWLDRDCPACSAPCAEAIPLFSKDGMQLVRCRSCSLTFSSRVLRPDLEQELYATSSFQSGYRGLKGNAAYAELETLKCRYLVQLLGAHAGMPGSLLDIGCGTGSLLESASQAGWRVNGIEGNPDFARACRDKGLNVTRGFFPEAQPEGEPCDAVCMLDVLEHARDPVASLAEAARLLAPSGILLLQVPNLNSLLVHLEGAGNSNFCVGHWNHFTRATLQQVAAAAGFRPLHTETIISELDLILRYPEASIRQAVEQLTGQAAPASISAPDWLHDRGLGYKLIGLFRPGTGIHG